MADHIGKYRIERTLGQGGMGVVYEAWDTSLDRAVALKTIIPELAASEEVKERLLREAKSAAQLQHPNVVTVYEFGEIDGQLFIAMEYIRGRSLGEELQKGLSLERKVQIMAQTCQALAYAHEAGIVHRDIKPSNIYISESGNVKLLDFGIAQIANSDLTKTGLTMGTPEYMSPEMVEGHEIDLRSDIFSCGVVFYEILTAVKPFKHERLATTLYKILHFDPPPLSDACPKIPQTLEKIVFGMLEKDVEKRFQSLKPAVEEIEHLQAQFLMAKAAKAKELNDLFKMLESDIRQVSGGEAARRLVEQQFQEELAQARQNVGRLSKASNTSISLEMVQSELRNLQALREKIAGYSEEELNQRIRKIDAEPTRRLEADETPFPSPAPEDEEASPTPEAIPSAGPADKAAPAGRGKILRLAAATAGGLLMALILWSVFQGTPDGGPPAEPPPPTEPSRQELSLQMRDAYEQGRLQDIAALAVQLEELGSLTAQELYYQGWALIEGGRFKEAIPPLTASLKSDPGNAYARLLLGRAHWRSSGRNEPALRHLLASLDQGALTAQEEQLARDTILEMEHVFAADHLHGRRLIFGGGKCSGSLVFSKDAARFQDGQGGGHNVLLAFATVGSIVLDEGRLTIRHGSGETAFELTKEEEVAWMEKLLGKVYRFEVTSGDSGTTYQLN